MPSRKGRKKQQRLPFTLDKDLQKEILAVLLIAMGGVTVLALLSVTKGAVSEAWILFLRRIFGWGVYLVAVALIGGGVSLLWEDLQERFPIGARGVLGLEVLFLSLLGLSHLLAAPEDAFKLAERGGGGGYIGWAITYFLITAVGRGVSFLLLLLAAGGGLVLALSVEWDQLTTVLGKAKARLRPQRQNPSKRRRSQSSGRPGGDASSAWIAGCHPSICSTAATMNPTATPTFATRSR